MRYTFNQLQICIMALQPERFQYFARILPFPSKEEALTKLRKKSGENFGEEIDKWAAWLMKDSRDG